MKVNVMNAVPVQLGEKIVDLLFKPGLTRLKN
jgi:hypothetical protein